MGNSLKMYPISILRIIPMYIKACSSWLFAKVKMSRQRHNVAEIVIINVPQQAYTSHQPSADNNGKERTSHYFGKCLETIKFCGRYKYYVFLFIVLILPNIYGNQVLPEVDEQVEVFAVSLNLTAVQLQGHTTTIARLPGLFKQIGRELGYSKHYILESNLAEGEWQEKLIEKIREMVRLFEEAGSNTYQAVLNGRSMFYFALDVLPTIESGFFKGDFSIAKDFLQKILEKIKANKILLENTSSSLKNVEGLADETHTMISRKMGQLRREATDLGSDWSLSGKVALSATGAVILAATATGPLGWIGIGAKVALGGVGAASGMWYADLDDSARENTRRLLGNDFGKLAEISGYLNNAKESLDSAEKDIAALIHKLSDAKEYTESLHGYLSHSYRATFRKKLESVAKIYKDAYDTFNDAIDKYRGASSRDRLQ